MTQKLLVTCSSGDLGSSVLNQLLNTLNIPLGYIIATTRKQKFLTEFADLGEEIR